MTDVLSNNAGIPPDVLPAFEKLFLICVWDYSGGVSDSRLDEGSWLLT
jgi:hypothetical protein